MAGINEGNNDTNGSPKILFMHVPSGKACALPLVLFNLYILAENRLFRQIQGITRVSTNFSSAGRITAISSTNSI